MDNREEGLVEIYERIKAKKDDIGLLAFRRTPTKPLDPNQVPLGIMLEDVDTPVKPSDRTTAGYPARRVLEVNLELICNERDHDIKSVYKEFRKAVFMDRGMFEKVNVKVADGVFINENRCEGPYPYGIPNLLGMRLILNLIYTDKGV